MIFYFGKKIKNIKISIRKFIFFNIYQNAGLIVIYFSYLI